MVFRYSVPAPPNTEVLVPEDPDLEMQDRVQLVQPHTTRILSAKPATTPISSVRPQKAPISLVKPPTVTSTPVPPQKDPDTPTGAQHTPAKDAASGSGPEPAKTPQWRFRAIPSDAFSHLVEAVEHDSKPLLTEDPISDLIPQVTGAEAELNKPFQHIWDTEVHTIPVFLPSPRTLARLRGCPGLATSAFRTWKSPKDAQQVLWSWRYQEVQKLMQGWSYV